MEDMSKIIFTYGGTVIMAVLFVYAYIEDRKANTKRQEQNTEMLRNNTEMLKILTESNNNISKSLDIISDTLKTIDDKVDRNYQEELTHKK